MACLHVNRKGFYMKITYIHHSGFLIETEHALLLFDYAGGTLPELNPDKDLIVLVSHRHEDHFSPEIFNLIQDHPNTRYVISDDIWQNRVPEDLACRVEFTDPHDVTKLTDGSGICVTTFRSTDEGVAFIVETEGKTIYHAGDLNDWRWPGEDRSWNNNMAANYQRELEKIRDTGFHPDIAMVPLDGRQEEWFCLGMDAFMRTVGAEQVFPMHFWKDYTVISRFKELPCSEPYRDRIADIAREGQTFLFL